MQKHWSSLHYKILHIIYIVRAAFGHSNKYPVCMCVAFDWPLLLLCRIQRPIVLARTSGSSAAADVSSDVGGGPPEERKALPEAGRVRIHGNRRRSRTHEQTGRTAAVSGPESQGKGIIWLGTLLWLSRLDVWNWVELCAFQTSSVR